MTGQPPERHGVSWNNVPAAKFDTVEVPTIFSVATARGYNTAAFFSKSKFNPLRRPGTLDYSQAPGGWFGRWSGSHTVTDVEKHLEDVEFAELTTEVCDGRPSDVERGGDEGARGMAVMRGPGQG